MIQITVELMKLSEMTQIQMEFKFNNGRKFTAKPIVTKIPMADCLDMLQCTLNAFKDKKLHTPLVPFTSVRSVRGESE